MYDGYVSRGTNIDVGMCYGYACRHAGTYRITGAAALYACLKQVELSSSGQRHLQAPVKLASQVWRASPKALTLNPNLKILTLEP